MEQKKASEADPMEMWTKPRYRKQIDTCLNCTKPRCFGRCRFSTGLTKETRRLVALDVQHIRELLAQKGYATPADLSRACGFHRETLAHALRESSMSFFSAKIVAKTLEVPLAEILRKG